MECYERLKGKNGGAAVFQPLSTGIDLRPDRKGAGNDKIPAHHRRLRPQRKSSDGGVFKWNFPIAGTYWVASRRAWCRHIGKKEGGLGQPQGQEDRAWSTTTARSARSRSRCCRNVPPMLGFQLQPAARDGARRGTESHLVAGAPEQARTTSLLWGWGVMNSTAHERSTGHRLPA